MQGGPVGMSILTALLVALLFAAWKAPAWVKEIGAAGLAFSLFMIAISWYKAATAVKYAKEPSHPPFFGAASNVAWSPSSTA